MDKLSPVSFIMEGFWVLIFSKKANLMTRLLSM